MIAFRFEGPVAFVTGVGGGIGPGASGFFRV